MRKTLWLLLISCFVLSCTNKSENEQAAKPEATAITKTTDVLIDETQPKHELIMSEIKKVSIAEAKKLAKQGYKFLDVRTPEEIERGKVEGAIEMNVKTFDFQQNVNNMDRDVKLIVYCSAGNRSALACKLFSTLNFTNVVEMAGGYSEWRTSENK